MISSCVPAWKRARLHAVEGNWRPALHERGGWCGHSSGAGDSGELTHVVVSAWVCHGDCVGKPFSRLRIRQ